MIKQNQRFFNFLLIVIDIMIITLSFYFTFFLRFESGIFKFESHLDFFRYSKTLVYILPLMVILNYFYGLYSIVRTKAYYYEIYSIIKSSAMLFVAILGIFFFIKEVDISRKFIALYIVFNIIFLTLFRIILRLSLKSLRKKGYNLKHILLIGISELSKSYLNEIIKNKNLGYICEGILDDDAKKNSKILGVKILGNTDELTSQIEKLNLDEVVIGLSLSKYEKLAHILNICENAGVKTYIIPQYMKYVSSRPQIEEVGDIPLINTRYIPQDNIANKILKRLFDFVLSLFAILLLLPIMAIIAILIKLTSKGPLIFSQQRVGLNKKLFTMYKFRTMIVQSNNSSDKTWTTKDDARTTKIGKLLRKTSLDELPQLFNVLKGDMSLIGPRPERPFFVEQFKEQIPKYMIKHLVRPGISGWAQVNGLRGDTSIEKRIEYDIYYIENWSIFFDIRIIFLTILKGFKNAY